MFKIKGAQPTSFDSIEIIADYIEYRTLVSQNSKISFTEIAKSFTKPADETATNGVSDYEDKVNQIIEEVTNELVRRANIMHNKYPFLITNNGYSLEFQGFNKISDYYYIYLLFATRLNMKDNRTFGEVDGSELFEFLSGVVAQNYFGANSKHLVFGTAMGNQFPEKVSNLCSRTGEGIIFQNNNEGPVDENDDKLDIVVWIDFTDKMPSKFIGFGQCKTGTNWLVAIHQLQPLDFCTKWMKRRPAVIPIRMFFICDVLLPSHWYKRSVDAGIIFDRLRVIDFLPNQIDNELSEKIKNWTEAAVNFARN